MGRQRATWVIAAAVLVSGCIPRTYPTALPSDDTLAASDDVASGEEPARPAARELTPAERQVQELEAQLAERDRTIATVQNQLRAARQEPAADASAGGTPSAAAAAAANTGAAGSAGSAGAAAAAAGGAGANAAAALAAKDAELGEAKRQIATLETKLEGEIQRRKQVENEMAKVLEETSSGPFERGGANANMVDKHLRDQLASAQQEIGELRATIAGERKERGDLERRYAALQQQLERTVHTGNDSEEVAALKERQRRVLASIQQDLAASQQRESELRAALNQDGNEGVSLADSVTSLRAENTALQRRLDDEHRQNRELASKLKLAGRVTDLIFKMQSSGATTASAVSQ